MQKRRAELKAQSAGFAREDGADITSLVTLAEGYSRDSLGGCVSGVQGLQDSTSCLSQICQGLRASGEILH